MYFYVTMGISFLYIVVLRTKIYNNFLPFCFLLLLLLLSNSMN